MKKSISMGIAPRGHKAIIHIGKIWAGIGIADFSGSIPRFAYFGSIQREGRDWNYMIRIWNIAFQIFKMKGSQ